MLPLLWSVMTNDWVHGVGNSHVCKILLQIVVRALITSSPPAWTSSSGMLSTPADFPVFNNCTAASTSLRRTGWSFSVSVLGQFCTDGFPLALWLYNSEQYSIHWFSICRSSVRHFPERSWTVVAFPYFTVVKSFTSWYALLLLFFLRFSSISLHCSPIQFSLAFFMHLLMLLFTSLYFSESGDHWIYVCMFIAHDGETCKPPAFHSLEGFQHVGIFQLFEVKIESCVFWLADFFSGEGGRSSSASRDHFNVCSWKTSCSGNVHSWSEAFPY